MLRRKDSRQVLARELRAAEAELQDVRFEEVRAKGQLELAKQSRTAAEDRIEALRAALAALGG